MVVAGAAVVAAVEVAKVSAEALQGRYVTPWLDLGLIYLF